MCTVEGCSVLRWMLPIKWMSPCGQLSRRQYINRNFQWKKHHSSKTLALSINFTQSPRYEKIWLIFLQSNNQFSNYLTENLKCRKVAWSSAAWCCSLPFSLSKVTDGTSCTTRARLSTTPVQQCEQCMLHRWCTPTQPQLSTTHPLRTPIHLPQFITMTPIITKSNTLFCKLITALPVCTHQDTLKINRWRPDSV